MKTLEKFLRENHVCKDGFTFAKDLTLEQFLNTCERGDWIIWLFKKTNPDCLKELTLAKGHCANTVRHLMRDERSVRAVDVAIGFGEGNNSREELNAYTSYAAAAYDDGGYAYIADPASYAAAAAHAAAGAAYAAAGAGVGGAGAAYAAEAAAYAHAYIAEADADAWKANQKLTADICKKYLPLEIWDQSKL